MRTYTSSGELRTTGGSGGAREDAGEDAGEILAAGTLSAVSADPDGVAVDQPLRVDEDSDGIAQAQAPTQDVSLVLEAVASELVPPRPLTLTSTGDLSAVTFTIEGVDFTGSPISEQLAGPNNETVQTSNVYRSVTSITPDATSVELVSAGWPDSDTPYPLALAATTFSPARRLTFTSSDDFSAVTFTVYGLDENGQPVQIPVTGPNAGTVTTSQYFSVVNVIVPDGLEDGTLSVGWAAQTAELYTAPNGAVLSHIFLRNTDAAEQTVELFLVYGTVEIPWRRFALEEHEVASVLHGENPLPLSAGSALRATSTTPGVVAFTVHGAAR